MKRTSSGYGCLLCRLWESTSLDWNAGCNGRSDTARSAPSWHSGTSCGAPGSERWTRHRGLTTDTGYGEETAKGQCEIPGQTKNRNKDVDVNDIVSLFTN